MDGTRELLAAACARAGYDGTTCHRLASEADELTVPAMKLLVREGEPSGAVFFVLSGAVEVFLRGEPVARAGPGELVRPTLPETGEPVSVRTVVRTSCLRVTNGALEVPAPGNGSSPT